MRFNHFEYYVSAEIEISSVEIEGLIKIGSGHYDSVCKAAVLCGGFVYGWQQRQEINGPSCISVEATGNELQILAKILEMLPYYPPSQKPAGLDTLRGEINVILYRISKESLRLKEQIV